MSRLLLSILLATSLLAGLECYTKPYDYLDALGDVAFFFPSTGFVLKKAMQIWRDFKKIQPYFQTGKPIRPSDSKKIQQILNEVEKISTEINRVQGMIHDKVMTLLPKEIGLDHKMIIIYQTIGEVDTFFHDFLLYIDPTKTHEEETMQQFRKKVIEPGTGGMRALLPKIYNALMEVNSGVDVLNILSNEKQVSELMCKREQSSQHLLNNLYNNIMFTEIKGIVMAQYAYTMNRPANDTTSFKTEIEDYMYQAYLRISRLIPKFQSVMSVASRDVWKCDAPRHAEGTTFFKLDPIFQRYVMPEEDGGIKQDDGSVKSMGDSENCPYYKHAFDLCKSMFCSKFHADDRCNGIIRDCESIDSYMTVCKMPPGSGRRYQYIELKNAKEVYGTKKKCKPEDQVGLAGDPWTELFAAKENCFCTCDDAYNNNMARYFSLRDVVSDVEDNKVITGAMLVKKDLLFYVQIQQGVLIEHGNVAQRSNEWKPIHSFNVFNKDVVDGRDYHKITWDSRKVNIDTIESPANSVLTGLRFAVDDGALKLEIRYTPFDFESGKLDDALSTWVSSPSRDGSRSEIKFDDDLPFNHVNLASTKNKAFVTFKTSSLKTDVGQNVVPYIDAQPVSSTPLTLLSGAGIVYRQAKGSSGFLSLKLKTYDYSPHLSLNAKDEQAMDELGSQYDINIKQRIRLISNTEDNIA